MSDKEKAGRGIPVMQAKAARQAGVNQMFSVGLGLLTFVCAVAVYAAWQFFKG